MNWKLIIKRILFYLISFTWGIITSFAGLVMITTCALKGSVHTFHGRLYGTIGKSWGGLELGCFFICGENDQSEHLCKHECGHGIQNIIFGPFFLLIIGIPSAIRYWYRRLKYERHGINPPTAYDDAWFEGLATHWGDKYILTDRI